MRDQNSEAFAMTAEERLQELIGRIDGLRDATAREIAFESLRAVMEFHGAALARLLRLIENAGEKGRPIFEAMGRDQLVRGLLLAHDLHPESLETRLHQALEKVRPYMQSHGGGVELANLENGVAKLRFHGACETCPASAVTMEMAIRQAVEEACPDLLGLELEKNGLAK